MIEIPTLLSKNRNLSFKHKWSLILILGLTQVYRVPSLRKISKKRGFGYFLRLISRIGVFEFQVSDSTGKCIFEVSSNDKYWLNAFLIEKNYEIEILEFLEKITFEFNFIDLGSNIGYWAVMTKTLTNCKKIEVVEANPHLIQKIQKNLEINSIRAKVLNKAVVANPESNVKFHIPIDSSQHSSSSVNYVTNSEQISVEAINYDFLIGSNLEDNRICVVKMDLEGIEHDILLNSNSSNDHRVIVIYEEHGSDSTHRATEIVLSRNLHDVFLLLPNNKSIKITSSKQLSCLKTDMTKGYNCVLIHKMLDIKF